MHFTHATFKKTARLSLALYYSFRVYVDLNLWILKMYFIIISVVHIYGVQYDNSTDELNV